MGKQGFKGMQGRHLRRLPNHFSLSPFATLPTNSYLPNHADKLLE
jgi:hypothetical protein